MNRKKFLQLGLAGTVLLATPTSMFGRHRTGKKLNILMLGGTNFVGPHLVKTAFERGHNVTLFNRGISNLHLFSGVEKLRGNRYPDRDNGLSALDNSRRWDAVIDTWQAEPGCVGATARMLRERTGQYLYISSIATYRNYKKIGMEEDGPLLEAGEYVDSFKSDLSYSIRKRASEQVVEQHFNDRGTILRCTSIQGLNYSADASDHTSYWSYRFLKGLPILLPDDKTAKFQLIDVKDMAKFAIRAIENRYEGAYNMVGPTKPLPFKEYPKTWAEVTDHQSELIWADPQWLQENGVRPFSDIRNWIPVDNNPEPGFYQISNKKALGDGLTYRPLEHTLRDGIASKGSPDNLDTPANGISLKREQELIEAWNNAKRKTSNQPEK